MKKKQLLFAGMAAVLLAGCDLERYPYTEIPADKLDPGAIETITRGSYAQLKEESYYKIIHQVAEYGGDNISLSGTTSDALFTIYSIRRTATNSYSANFWAISYKAMININAMIEQIKEAESPEKDQLLGENYFLRGLLYFNLCNVYGRPYSHQNPETDLGVPIKLSTREDDYPPRASVKEVYEQIIKDWEKAESLMSVNKPNKYASKEVVQAYLSRLYLYMGENPCPNGKQGWENAYDYADKVIQSGRYKLLSGSAYSTYPQAAPEANDESIFVIRMTKDVDFQKYSMGYYSVGALYATINETGWGEMYPSATYLDLLNKNASDLRHGFIVPNKLAQGYKWLRYINNTPMYVTRKVEARGANAWYIPLLVDKIEGQDTTWEEESKFPFTSHDVQSDAQGFYVIEKTGSTRRDVVIEDAIQTRNDYPMWYIYKCSLQEGQSQLYSPVMIRLGEMYLNRAEAAFELGKDDKGLADINEIRRRATIPELTAITIDDILNERRLELAWEAQRKYDIYRRGQTLNRNYPGTHLTGSPVRKTVEPTSELIVELIPQRELDAYPIALTQNPQ